MRRTLRIAAKQLYEPNDTAVYQESLRRISVKVKRRKSRVARVLREILVKAEKLGE